MELHKALARAVTFTAKGKTAPGLYQSIQLLPGAAKDDPSRVYATDGLLGCLIDVDIELPLALLAAEAVKPVSKQAVSLVERQGEEIHFRLAAGGLYKLAEQKVIGWPGVPTLPLAMGPVASWRWARKVLHAASDPKEDKPTYQYVRFGPTGAEATDSFRVAVVEASVWPEEHLIPARLFKGWTGATKPLAHFDAERSWFRIGSEFRWAPTRADIKFPDCHKIMPTDYQGPTLAVDARKLLGAVRRATTVSTLKTVALDFSGNSVAIKSWSAAEGGKSFRAVLSGNASDPNAKAVKVISGKLLAQALATVETPNVRLCYRDVANEPLRVESGIWAESLWPWKVEDGV